MHLRFHNFGIQVMKYIKYHKIKCLHLMHNVQTQRLKNLIFANPDVNFEIPAF